MVENKEGKGVKGPLTLTYVFVTPNLSMELLQVQGDDMLKEDIAHTSMKEPEPPNASFRKGGAKETKHYSFQNKIGDKEKRWLTRRFIDALIVAYLSFFYL